MVSRQPEKDLILKALGKRKLQMCEIIDKTGLTTRIVTNCLCVMKKHKILNHESSTGMWWKREAD